MSSADLHKRRSAAVARGVSSMISSYVDHAAGGMLTDVDGREWIDFGCVWINTHIPIVAEMPHGGFKHSG